MNRSSGYALWLNLLWGCFFVLCASNARAQMDPFKFGTYTATPQELVQRVATNSFWTWFDERPIAPKDPNSCATNRAILLKPKDDKNTTLPQRLAAVRIYENCITLARSYLLAAAASKSPNFESSFVTTNFVDSLLKSSELELSATATEVKSTNEFMGMTFGVGVGFSQSRKERITDAEKAADGTLRVKTRVRQEPRVILEAHYYPWCGGQSAKTATGCGPFFGIAPTGDTINAFALGFMYGFKDPKGDASTGFSIGIGAVLDREAKTLASGFEEGKPLPAGETEPKFESRSRWSPMLFFTRTF